MATRRQSGAIVKQGDQEAAEAAGLAVADRLEELARQGAREMLMTTLNEEVEAYLGRGWYQRQEEFRGYRNGTSPLRLTLGSGTVELRTPRVRDIPRGQEPFESRIIRK